MSTATLHKLYEDEFLIVLNKPVGLATTGVPPGQPSLHRQTLLYLQEKSPSVSFLGCVSRLDMPVGGIVVFAKTSEVAHDLARQIRQQQMRKTYHAVVSGCFDQERGTLCHWLRKRGVHSKVRCVAPGSTGAQEARLSYHVLRAYHQATLVEIHLHTGRKHQIRTQFSRIGHPIWGDYKYGSRMELAQGIALIAKEIHFPHPHSGRDLHFQVDYHSHWPYDVETLSQKDRTWLGREP